MAALRYRILNVFTVDGDRFSGNPLCVFENAEGLAEKEMQALARQMNLSESTFLLSPTVAEATARVRIFTPTFELPFAGHPTLGTAHVVRQLQDAANNCVVLEMGAGLVEVVGEPATLGRNDRWTLRTARAPESRPASASREVLAAMLGLPFAAIADTPLWVDTGSEQLVVPLKTAAHVRSAKPNGALLEQHGFSERRGASMAYVWAPLAEDALIARFFFVSNGGVVEDAATGSACANLGGYLLAMRRPLPIALTVHQGEAVGRPSELGLRVDRERRIFVSGAVEELGGGTIRL